MEEARNERWKKSHKNALLEHINSIDNNIKFTCEESRDDGSIPFLDILIIPEEDGRLNTTVYRKPTHTDLYLQWDSHHNIPSKYSVIGTLFHRAKSICSSPQHLQKEEQHLTSALKRCKYPTWALNRVKLKNPKENSNKNNRRGTKSTRPEQLNINQPHIVVPYHQGLSENFKRTCSKHGVQVHPKGALTIKNLLMAPKDKDTIMKKSGVIYRYKCNRVGMWWRIHWWVSKKFLQRGSRNTLRPLLPSMTILSSLVTVSLLTTSV